MSKEIKKFVTKCSECSLTDAEKSAKRKPNFHDKEYDVGEFSKQGGSRNFPGLHWIQSGVFEVSNLFQICFKLPNIDL